MISINSENKDQLLFDLLEGNLTKSEEKQLLQYIENDEELKFEWEMMQLTVLKKPSLVYKKEHQLLKEPVIKSSQTFKWMLAASLLLALGILGYYFNSIKQQNTDIFISENHFKSSDFLLPNLKVDNEIGKILVNPKKSKTSIDKSQTTVGIKTRSDVQKSVEYKENGLYLEGDQTYQTNELILKKENLQLISIAEKSMDLVHHHRKDSLLNIHHPEFNNNSKNKLAVTLSNINRVLIVSSQIIKKLRNTDIELKGEFKNLEPHIYLELENESEIALVSINLKRNKNEKH